MPSGLFTRRQHLQAVITNSWAGRPSSVDYLVVAGGGGGGRNWGGGGGAGGLLQGTIAAPTTATTVTVGAGGLGDTSDTPPKGGTSGGNSIFGAIVALGGGLGGSYNGIAGAAGGSGGGQGAGSNPGTLGQGTFGQGNAGGSSPPENVNSQNTTGGGGGAGTIGISSTTTIAGRGGSGIASDMSGSRVLYAGGGGGTANAGATGAGAGGVGGGGTGSWYGTSNAISGTPNTGGGGGGAHYTGISGTGGSGIVIISYPGTTQWYSGGTLSYSNNRVTHTFYSSGTLTPIQPVEYADTTYQISRSLRFNSADSAYLNRTPASAGNRKTFTWSAWVKFCAVDGAFLFTTGIGSSIGTYFEIARYSNGVINIANGTTDLLRTTAVFRDASAWYHIVVSVNTTNATADDRVCLYVNGSQVTAFATRNNPTQNTDLGVNNTIAHYIATSGYSGSLANYGNFYLTEVNFIDGLALTPQAFGFTNPNTGVWSPLRYTGSYGTNGFYLNFSDNSNNTASTLGKDNSGNTNNWTTNNFSVTAGAGNDSLVDTPTPYGTDTGAGGEVRGNYCLWNPLSTSRTLTNGNLYTEVNGGGGSNVPISATMAIPTTGKWYWEITAGGSAGGGNGGWDWGIVNITVPNFRLNNLIVVGTGGCYGVNGNDGNFRENNVTGITGYISGGIANGDVAQVAYDADNGKLWLGKNNTWGNDGSGNGDPAAGLRPAKTAASGMTGQFIPVFEYASDSGVVSATANFGQRPFAYSAPSGFKALCTQNLPTPTIGATAATQANKYFNAVTYTGDSTTNRVIPTWLQSDFVWIKRRDAAVGHLLFDAIRGAGKTLRTEQTNGESNDGSYYVQQFNSNNFLMGNGDTASNTTGATYVSWVWSAGGSNAANTAGSIASTVRANTTSGFSIVTYTGNGSSGATVGHGLGATPAFVIIKDRGAVSDWRAWTTSFGTGRGLSLNSTTGTSSNSEIMQAAPTSSLIYLLGAGYGVNNSGNTYVAYCFAATPGFSAFGSYTGNASTDGPYVYTGFRSRFIMIKNITGTLGNWTIYDTERNTYNLSGYKLAANINNVENDVTNLGDTTIGIDILSNGFKIRATGNNHNNSSENYIYAAFAETPFKYSRAR